MQKFESKNSRALSQSITSLGAGKNEWHATVYTAGEVEHATKVKSVIIALEMLLDWTLEPSTLLTLVVFVRHARFAGFAALAGKAGNTAGKLHDGPSTSARTTRNGCDGYGASSCTPLPFHSSASQAKLAADFLMVLIPILATPGRS